MPYTEPDQIYYRDANSPVSLEAESATQAGSIQRALSESRALRTYRWASSMDQDAQSNMVAGDMGYREDLDKMFRFNGFSWVGFMPGLNIMAPTSSSGTVTPSGKVSFSGAEYVDLDGVFIPEIERYQLHVYSEPSENSRILARLRAAGTPAASNSYVVQQFFASDTSTSAARSTGTYFNFITGTTTGPSEITLSVDGPASPRSTRVNGQMSWGDATTILQMYSGIFTPTTAFDGIRIFPNTGTFTGSIAVYGFYE